MRKIFHLMMTAIIVLAVSCKKDKDAEPAAPLSTTEAKSALDASTNNIASDLEGITKAEGFVAVNNLQGANTPFGNPVKYAVNVAKSKRLKDLKALKAEDFKFEDAKGEWQYVYATESVEKMANSTITDRMVLHFPSDSNKKEVNDAVLTVYAYTETIILQPDTLRDYFTGQITSIRMDTSYRPTKLLADIMIGTNKIVDVKLLASYTTAGDPTMIDATVSMAPYTLTALYSEVGAKQTASFSVKKDGRILTAAGVTITYPSSSDRSTPDFFEGYVQLDNIKAKGSIDIKGMNALVADPTAADFNTYVKVAFYKADNDAKVCDLKAFDEVESYGGKNAEIYLVFADGTKEKPQVYIDKLTAKLPDFLQGDNVAAN